MIKILGQQDEISIEFDGAGNVRLVQAGPYDALIYVSRDNVDAFVDRLTDALGIPSDGLLAQSRSAIP